MTDRSNTPPPPTSFSPPPLSNSGNLSPPVSPVPRRREDVPVVELSPHDTESAGEAHAQPDSADHVGDEQSAHEQHVGDAHAHVGDSGEIIAQEHHEAPVSSPPPEQQPSISPFHSPVIEDYEQDSTNANAHAHAHEHEHENVQEAAEHATTPIPTPTTTPEPAVDSHAHAHVLNNVGASTSAPPSPLPNGTPIKKQPELHEKLKCTSSLLILFLFCILILLIPH